MLKNKQIMRTCVAELVSNKLFYSCLFVILILGLFLRVYRQNELLGFWFDQGRDLLAASKIVYEGEITLIGPTTGFEGIFRGPFYYYYLLPGIILGGGDPIVVSNYLTILNSLGLVAIFLLARVFWNRMVGLIAVVLYSFSYMLISFDRWLSHPPILTLFAPLTFGFILASQKFNKKFLIPGLFLLGLTLQLEEAGMLFVTFGVFLLLLFKYKYYGVKVGILSLLAFAVTFLPLAIFDLRHSFLISNNILKLFKHSSDKPGLLGAPDINSLISTFWFYTSTLGGSVFYNLNWGDAVTVVGLVIFFITIFFYLKKNIYDIKTKLLLIWVFFPFIFYTFYKGDLYGYYLAGVFPLFIILVSLLLNSFRLLQNMKIFLIGVFLVLFVISNKQFIINLMVKDVNKDNNVLISNELSVMDFIKNNSQGKTIWVDAYVPPQIPYAYQYLTWWYEKKGEISLAKKELDAVDIYTIIENDDIHPYLRKDFIGRFDNKSAVVKEATFGGILVQKREIKNP